MSLLENIREYSIIST